MSQIDHPEYYKSGNHEAIDYIEAHNLNFNLGNVIKYVTRAGRKSADLVTDLEKAEWYLKREITRQKKKEAKNMHVKLLTSPEFLQEQENNAVKAMLICHANEDKDVNNQEALSRIIRLGHESILEHINLTFRIENLSRACLQELARHRHISLSVESTRHTLRKQINTMPIECSNGNYSYLSKFNREFREFANAHPDMPNDELKYFIPEFWPTRLILTLNVRALRWLLKLRSEPVVLKEFRVLVRKLFNAVPDKFKYLVEGCLHE